MKGMARIDLVGRGTFLVPPGRNLREALRAEGVYLDGTCGDRGVCGRCRVTLVKGDAGEPSASEKGLLGPEDLADGVRLACRVSVAGDMTITVEDERILEMDRVGRWKSAFGSSLWDPRRYRAAYSGYGVAVDMGTTSVASALVYLPEGRVVDVTAGGNPLLPWGDEILSRLQAARDDGELAGEMARLTWREVRRQVAALTRRFGISTGAIRRLVAVGNSAQYVLARGLSPVSLLTPPYGAPPVDADLLCAGDLAGVIGVPEQTPVLLPPPVGGYAGSDALVSLLAARGDGARNGALIDAGTNSEIAVWNGHRCFAASAPAGPAFEGGSLRSGMPAAAGAVWKVEFFPGGLRCRVLGDVPATGVCGTGVIDAVAGMLKNGVLDQRGTYRHSVHPAAGPSGLQLVPGAVLMTPADMEAVQKAKAAIRATLDLLLRRAGLEPGGLEKVYLSGAFGSRLDLASAMTAGLVPRLPVDRFVLAGNTAMVGAVYLLLSAEAEKEAGALLAETTHVDAAEAPEFEELFLNNLYYEPVEQ